MATLPVFARRGGGGGRRSHTLFGKARRGELSVYCSFLAPALIFLYLFIFVDSSPVRVGACRKRWPRMGPEGSRRRGRARPWVGSAAGEDGHE